MKEGMKLAELSCVINDDNYIKISTTIPKTVPDEYVKLHKNFINMMFHLINIFLLLPPDMNMKYSTEISKIITQIVQEAKDNL